MTHKAARHHSISIRCYRAGLEGTGKPPWIRTKPWSSKSGLLRRSHSTQLLTWSPQLQLCRALGRNGGQTGLSALPALCICIWNFALVAYAPGSWCRARSPSGGRGARSDVSACSASKGNTHIVTHAQDTRSAWGNPLHPASERQRSRNMASISWTLHKTTNARAQHARTIQARKSKESYESKSMKMRASIYVCSSRWMQENWLDRQADGNKTELSMMCRQALQAGHRWEQLSHLASFQLCREDGLDQAKYKTPRDLNPTHAFAAMHRPALHVQGAWSHGFAFHIAVSDDDMKKDTNNNVEIFARMQELSLAIVGKVGRVGCYKDLLFLQIFGPRAVRATLYMRTNAQRASHFSYTRCVIHVRGTSRMHDRLLPYALRRNTSTSVSTGCPRIGLSSRTTQPGNAKTAKWLNFTPCWL